MLGCGANHCGEQRQVHSEGYKAHTPRNPRRAAPLKRRFNEMVGRLEGKVAIVTGGGHGFGLGIVEKFVEEGAKVVIFDINKEVGEKAAAAHKVTFVQGDVSVKKDWEKALEVTLKEYGKLNIVVNNAGILIVKVCAVLIATLTGIVDDRIHRRGMGKTLQSQRQVDFPKQSSYHSIHEGARRRSLHQYLQFRRPPTSS